MSIDLEAPMLGRRLAMFLAVCMVMMAASMHLTNLAHSQSSYRPHLARPGLDYVRLFGGSAGETNAVLALGSRDNVFLAGTSTSRDWPVARDIRCVPQTCSHAFLLKLRPDASAAFYQVAIGGTRSTTVSAI